MTAPPSESLRLPNIALLLGLSWLVIVVQLLAAHWAETAQTLLDMDDAMRLVQMRGFVTAAAGSTSTKCASVRPTATTPTGRV